MSVNHRAVGLIRYIKDSYTLFRNVIHRAHHRIFRPVIIYSMLYRSWGSMRSKEFLKVIAYVASQRQFGFMPSSDASEMWLMIQAQVECAVQTNIGIQGFVTDLQKAFENIPRLPIYELVVHMGMDIQIANLWFDFLAKTQRMFLVKGEVGQPVKSNRGLPEGDALSCLGMSIIDLTFHAYMEQFAPQVRELSFVDNLEILSRSIHDLQSAIVCVQTWIQMWEIPLDEGKSYTWTSNKSQRSELSSCWAGESFRRRRIWERLCLMGQLQQPLSRKVVLKHSYLYGKC